MVAYGEGALLIMGNREGYVLCFFVVLIDKEFSKIGRIVAYKRVVGGLVVVYVFHCCGGFCYF